MGYRLHFDLDTASLRSIYDSGQYITLVKSTASTLPPAGVVTWVAFAPFQHSTVTWDERRTVYASATTLRDGVRVEVLTAAAADPGSRYLLLNGTFDRTGDGLPESYTVVNGEREWYAFGLAQNAMVNSIKTSAPTTVATLEAGGTVIFTASEEVSVFLAPFGNSGILLPELPSYALKVQLSATRPVAHLDLDLRTKTFRRSST